MLLIHSGGIKPQLISMENYEEGGVHSQSSKIKKNTLYIVSESKSDMSN